MSSRYDVPKRINMPGPRQAEFTAFDQ
jgi:hypothetical protein